MVELGFPDKFVKWMMRCLMSVRYFIPVNGGTETFQAATGLRQGNHLSPYLLFLWNILVENSISLK